MIHAICDFCGKDADLSATLLTLTPFQNFARYPRTSAPYGTAGEPRSFVICAACAKEKRLPNPHHDYEKLYRQDVGYAKTLDNYTDADVRDDVGGSAT